MNLQERSILFIIAAFLPASTFAGTYSGGTGEPNDPYLISTAEDLNDVGNHYEDFDKHFVLVNDINLADYTGTEFNIIGNITTKFKGVFDGNDRRIWNFSYSSFGGDYIGLFGYVDSDGQIKNLGMENVDVNDTNGNRVGGLAGYNRGTITNCSCTGSVTGNQYVGGLVGFNRGPISNCSVTASVEGTFNTGGLVGWNIFDGTISDCYAISNATGTGVNIGGLVGDNDGMISNCYAISYVSATGDYIGGLVGTNNGTASICYAIATVSGTNDTACLVGHNCSGTILNCYTTGSVEGTSNTGGLVGHNCTGTISNCYAIASVEGTSNTGGLVGDSGGTVSNSFWDIETGGSDNGLGTPLSTEQMKTESIFIDAGWDFIEIWDIGENQTYPFLRTHPAGDIDHDNIVNFYDLAILADHWLQDTH